MTALRGILVLQPARMPSGRSARDATMQANTKLQSGVKVFGSAVLRVEPDVASLQFAVSRQAKQPKGAFQETHQAVKVVRAYLAQAGAAGDVAASRITLTRTFEYVNGRQQTTGYSA